MALILITYIINHLSACFPKRFSDLTSCLPRFPARKRTPRLLVMPDQDSGDDINTPSKHSLEPDVDVSLGEDSHVAALALLEASQGSRSPFIYKEIGRTELCGSSSAQSINKCAYGEMARSNYIGAGLGNHCLKGTVGRKGANDSEDIRQLDANVVCPSEVQKKIKRIQVKGPQLLGNKSYRFEDAQELSTCAEKLNAKSFVDQAHIEVSKRNTELASQNQRKKTPKFLLEDGSSTLDMELLATIALQGTSVEPVPTVCARQQKSKDNSFHTSDIRATLYVNSESDNSKISAQGRIGHSSIASNKSSLPCSTSAHHGSDNYTILFQEDRGRSSNLAHKLHLHGTLSANPENDSKILSKEDRLLSVETNADSFKGAQQQKDMCPYAEVLPEVEEGNRPAFKKMQHINEDYLPPKVPEEVVRSFSLIHDIQKNEDGDLIKEDTTDNLYTCGKSQDGCLVEQLENSRKLSNPTEVIREQGGSIIANECVNIACGTSLGSLANCSNISLIREMKAKEAENKAVAVQHAMPSQDYMLPDMQSREADIKSIVDLSTALDKKEAVLKELKLINDHVSVRREAGDLITDFTHQYELVVGLLKDVSSATSSLKQSNPYSKNSTSPCLSSMECSAGLGGPPGFSNAKCFTSQDSNSHVLEIVASSRQQARHMVDAAVLAMSMKDEGEDAYMRITKALDSAENQLFGAEYGIQGTEYPCPHSKHGESTFQYEAVSCMTKPVTTVYAPNPGVLSSANESSSVSELISACVGTFFMIQTTSATRYPPAEVAGVLEHAVKSLQPRCSQNLKIYSDIEKCMGIIKTQMLALVTTPTLQRLFDKDGNN
ncbi:protein ALWAYS EARLY 3-like isoform X2 [Iris pallida]|uniref:Protein ALWAYS EARLY 3-like isoform X2 n=1 Tax=Iris pallida TaxID=29817 RepID=A0AAX6HE48_IRIPA|nr:protein ALWAYS EARLY 3-like isoform X2 [Iris pallida]